MAGGWRMAGRAEPAAAVWKALGRSDAVARAARGDALPAPAFSKRAWPGYPALKSVPSLSVFRRLVPGRIPPYHARRRETARYIRPFRGDPDAAGLLASRVGGCVEKSAGKGVATFFHFSSSNPLTIPPRTITFSQSFCHRPLSMWRRRV